MRHFFLTNFVTQAADVGIGIVGKEGKQASMAADFSINKFCFLSHLLLWHGRNSYKRSANLSQFVIHRGNSCCYCFVVQRHMVAVSRCKSVYFCLNSRRELAAPEVCVSICPSVYLWLSVEETEKTEM